MMGRIIRRWVTIIAYLLIVVSCASDGVALHDLDDVIAYQTIRTSDGELHVGRSPEDRKQQAKFFRKKELLINQTLLQADSARALKQFDEARRLYYQVLQAEPRYPRAVEGLRMLDIMKLHPAMLEGAANELSTGNLEGAMDKARRVLVEDPNNRQAQQLMSSINTSFTAHQRARVVKGGSVFQERITVEFRDANLRAVVDLLGKRYGINFLLDRDVRPDLKISIQLQNATLEDSLKWLLMTNQLDYRFLKDSMVLIFPKTPAKEAEYSDEVVRTFYIANADAKQVANLVKSIIKAKEVFVDERLNLIVMRDVLDKVIAAEKLITAQDMADAEVLLELEVLEVSTNRLMELGIQFPDSISSSIVGSSGTPGTLSWQEFTNLNSGFFTVGMRDPAIIINLRKIDTDTNLLANPRVRIKNKEKAKIHIGERVPVITTTATANVGVSESVTYLDTGLKLELQPNVYLHDEVSIKVDLEVSNILDTVTRASGTQTYRLGTRNTSTTLRLRDGETQMLAGLIQDDERNAANKVPLLGDIPLMGRLFSSRGGNKTKTEIVLLITPHVVRNTTRPDAGIVEFMPESSNLGGSVESTTVSGPNP